MNEKQLIIKLKEELKDKKIYIQYITGRPTNTGRSDYYRILIQSTNSDTNFTYIYQLNLGYYKNILLGRYNEKYDALSIGGYGYSKNGYLKEYISREFQVLSDNIQILN
jgi:hypothetical protein